MVQTRRCKIGKDRNLLCPLCKDEEESLDHFIASCTYLEEHRDDLKLKASEILEDHPWFAERLTNFADDYTYTFTQAVLLPYDSRLPIDINSKLLKVCLSYISKIHKSRSSAISQA